MPKKEEAQKLVHDEAKLWIITSNNAKQLLLQFIVTLNVAYFVGLFSLKDDPNKKWVVLLSIVIFSLNMLLLFIYWRHHLVISANLRQMKLIKKEMNPDLYNDNKTPEWFMFNSKYIDYSKGNANYLISLLLMLFVIIPINVSCYYIFKKNIAVSIVIATICIAAIKIFAIYLIHRNIKKQKKKVINALIKILFLVVILLVFIIVFLIYIDQINVQ